MYKNCYEIFEEFARLKNDKDRAWFLRQNRSDVLLNVLKATFHPDINFEITRVPNYKPSDDPIGLSPTTMNREIERAYLFQPSHPKKPKGLSKQRQENILIQILEGLEAKEAVVYMNMLLKNLKVPGLTKEIVKIAFPGLLP